MDLHVNATEQNGASVLKLQGEIDVYTAPQLREAIVSLVEGGARTIVIDLEAVDFLDSTGLGVLVDGLKRVKGQDGDLPIVATQEKILKIFEITGLNKAFRIHGSVEDAIGATVSE